MLSATRSPPNSAVMFPFGALDGYPDIDVHPVESGWRDTSAWSNVPTRNRALISEYDFGVAGQITGSQDGATSHQALGVKGHLGVSAWRRDRRQGGSSGRVAHIPA